MKEVELKSSLTQSKSAGLVTADVRDTSEVLQSVELPHNDMFLGHHSGASRHGEGQHCNERFGDDRNGGSDTIKHDLVGDPEPRDGENNYDEEYRTQEQEVSQLRQLDLERSS